MIDVLATWLSAPLFGLLGWHALAAVAAGCAGLAASFLIGRNTSRDTQHARELEVVLEDLRKEHECALSELEAAKHDHKRLQRELERRQAEVSDHFSETANLMRELAVGYRAVFEHMSEGARLLCPEKSPALEASFGQAALAPESDDAPRTTPGRANGGGAATP